MDLMIKSTNDKEDLNIKQDIFLCINFVSFSSEYFCRASMSKVSFQSRSGLLNKLIIFLFNSTFYSLLPLTELLFGFAPLLSELVTLCRQDRFREDTTVDV